MAALPTPHSWCTMWAPYYCCCCYKCLHGCLPIPHSCCTHVGPPTAAAAILACMAAYLPHIAGVPCGLPLLLLPTFPTWLLCLPHIAVVHVWAPYHCCCGCHSRMAAYLSHIAGVPCGLPLLLAPIAICMAACITYPT